MKIKCAFALAAVCFACTLIILFGHVRSTRDLTVIHLYIFVSFVVSVGAGYYVEHARLFTAIAFGLIFVVATGVCVTLSGSRSHASLEKALTAAAEHNAQRATITADIAAAHKALDKAQKLLDQYTQTINRSIEEAADQCATGKGSKCSGHGEGVALRTKREEQLTTSRDEARTRVDTLNTQLAATPLIEPNAELKPLADLYSLIFDTPADRSMHIVITILAYSLAILTEFSGITFMNFALNHTPSPPTLAPQDPSTLPLTPQPSQQPTTSQSTVTLATIARELKIDPRTARKRVKELGIAKPVQGWSFPPDTADDIKTRLSQLH